MASTDVGIDLIQNQIQHCEDIVDDIDTIVPKLYKIRQQALSQRNYISDINDKIFKTMTGVNNKIITFETDDTNKFDSTIINSTNLVTGFNGTITAPSEDSKKIIHSLFKFKHDLGTSAHFTTEQRDTSISSRDTGFNLVDVSRFTSGLNSLLSENATTAQSLSDSIKQLFMGARSSVDYDTNTLSDSALDTALTPIPITVSGNIIGFGIN
jgi:hypothetical protein